MTGSQKPVAVELDAVVDAFEFANAGGLSEYSAYICLDTGKIYGITGQEDLDEDIPEDIEDSDRYLALPDKRSLDLGSHLAFAFAEQEMADDYDTVRQIFRRRGAYGRFKDLLDRRRMLEKWYIDQGCCTRVVRGE